MNNHKKVGFTPLDWWWATFQKVIVYTRSRDSWWLIAPG